MFGQVIVMRLYRDYGILTQICGNNFIVLKVAPLVVSEEQVNRFVDAAQGVVEAIHTSSLFWTEALGLAARDERLKQSSKVPETYENRKRDQCVSSALLLTGAFALRVERVLER
jgi:predicted DNA-binding ribbon-helix-helix protein